MSDDLALWPRIEQAINATVLRRSLAESMFGEQCHRKQCGQRHGSAKEVFDYTIQQVRETVYTELLCQATSDPDLGEGE